MVVVIDSAFVIVIAITVTITIMVVVTIMNLLYFKVNHVYAIVKL